MRLWFVLWLRSYSDERRREWSADGHARLAGCGYDRHAQRVHWSVRSGAERVGEQSVVRSCLRLSRTARRSAQAVVVGWNRAMPDGETVGARSVYLVSGAEWKCIANGSAAVDAARGNRLATSDTHRCSAHRDVIA